MRYFFILIILVAAILSCSEERPHTRPAAEQKSDVELLRERIQKDPNDADALFHLAELYDRAGLYQEEAETLQKVVTLKPEWGYAHFKLGMF